VQGTPWAQVISPEWIAAPCLHHPLRWRLELAALVELLLGFPAQ
jgi:hypothetical protein